MIKCLIFQILCGVVNMYKFKEQLQLSIFLECLTCHIDWLLIPLKLAHPRSLLVSFLCPLTLTLCAHAASPAGDRWEVSVADAAH